MEDMAWDPPDYRNDDNNSRIERKTVILYFKCLPITFIFCYGLVAIYTYIDKTAEFSGDFGNDSLRVIFGALFLNCFVPGIIDLLKKRK